MENGVTNLEKAAEIDPNNLEIKHDLFTALNNLAWKLATSEQRDGNQAVKLAEQACRLSDYKQTIFIGTLAAAYAEAGRFDDAVSAAQKAIDLARANGEVELEQKNKELLELYRNHQPYHELKPLQ